MPQSRKVARLLCAVLLCVTLLSCFGISAYAADETSPAETTTPADDVTIGTPAEDTPATDAAPVERTMSKAQVEDLAALIAAATADSKAEDTRTPRDQFTAAYLAGDIKTAAEVAKAVNEAAKKKAVEGIDFDKFNSADVEALIKEMQTEVSMEKPTGFFALIQLAAGSVLSWFTAIVGGNYVLGLLIFAVIFELLTLPVAIKQQKNSIKQASLSPKEKAIRKKYAGRDDQVTKQKMATEIQEMYQKEGYNPASGCLPMILQLAVVMILYQVVVDPLVYVMKFSKEMSAALTAFINASEASGGLGLSFQASRGTIEIASLIKEYGAEFFEKLGDFVYFSNGEEIVEALKGASFPNFNLFGLNMGKVPSITEFSWLLLIPVLTFVVYYGSMKLTRKLTYQPAEMDKATGCSNNIMDITMPLFSVYICFVVPAALGVYWMFKSILSTVARIIMTKVMPVPTFTDEEYKAAEREIIKGKPAPAPRPGSSGRVVRSLHHIDDEDFEDTREAALARKAKLEEQEAAEREAAEAKQQRLSESNLIKNEDDRPQMSMKDMKKKLKEAKQKQAEEKKAAEAQNAAQNGSATQDQSAESELAEEQKPEDTSGDTSKDN